MRNVHRGDRNETGVQLLHPVPGKREHAPPSFSPQRYDKRPVVWCAALRIYFSLFLEATSLSPKKKTVYDIVKPSLFLKHIFQMECPVGMKKGCCRCAEIGAPIAYAGAAAWERCVCICHSWMLPLQAADVLTVR